jgi:hypothetical protein
VLKVSISGASCGHACTGRTGEKREAPKIAARMPLDRRRGIRRQKVGPKSAHMVARRRSVSGRRVDRDSFRQGKSEAAAAAA